MTDFDHEAYFERAGEDGVRAMLQGAAGLSDSSMSTLPSRVDAWAWLNRKRDEREAIQTQREAARDRWTKAGVILAGVAAVLAALSWLVPLRHG